MEKENIIHISKKILSDEFEVDSELITEEANIRETLNLDSLDYVDLVVVIESNFGFKVKAGDFTEIKTFGDFYQYINVRLAEKIA